MTLRLLKSAAVLVALALAPALFAAQPAPGLQIELKDAPPGAFIGTSGRGFSSTERRLKFQRALDEAGIPYEFVRWQDRVDVLLWDPIHAVRVEAIELKLYGARPPACSSLGFRPGSPRIAELTKALRAAGIRHREVDYDGSRWVVFDYTARPAVAKVAPRYREVLEGPCEDD